MIGNNCNGPLITNNGDEAVKLTEMESFSTAAHGGTPYILQPGQSVPCDIGLVKAEALLPPDRMLARWAGNFKPAAGHSRLEKTLYIEHKWPCYVDAVDMPMQAAPVDFDHPAAGLSQILLTAEELAAFKKWLASLS
jgi:hypothetical protein